MARARNIKPGFFKNPELVELPYEYRLLFIGLWLLADREGRLEDRPKQIRMELFPADDVDCDAGCQALHNKELIVRYVAGGKSYIWIPTFSEHQNPHIREAGSTIPPYQGVFKGQTYDLFNTTKDEPRHSLGNAEADASPADSLIPDSLIPEKGIVGQKPDAPAKQSAQPKTKLSEMAAGVLKVLNEKTGRKYRPTKANIGFIAARLREGASEADCRQVIVKKVREWSGDPKMEAYLRPKTLFCATNFDQYVGELVLKEVSNG